MGKQLLLIRHGLKQRSQVGLHLRGSSTKLRKAFPLLRHDSPTGQQTKGLNERGARPEAQAQQQPTSTYGSKASHHNHHTQPTQLRTKQHL